MTSAIYSKTLLARVGPLLGLLAAAVVLAALTAAGPARAAATFTVNGTADRGDANFADGRCDTDPATSGNQCTLRAAIEEANETAGADEIRFDISGIGVKTIATGSRPPTITEAVTIDGYTQPGAKKNTLAKGTNAVLLIQLRGIAAGDVLELDIAASNVVVRGLVINGFRFEGIRTGGANTRIEGNLLGTDPSGTQALGNGSGVNAEGLNAAVGAQRPRRATSSPAIPPTAFLWTGRA